MKFKTIDNFNVRGKGVLVRVDLNSEVSGGKIQMSDRISESAKTIAELKKKGARVVVLAHQGRKGDKDFTSLEQHAKLLNKFVKIKFVDDIIGAKAVREISELKNGEAILLENVRGLKEESDGGAGNNFVKTLAKYFALYVNDAFSVSHREQTSITGFPKVLPSCVGRTMEKELNALAKLDKMKNALFILGGSKTDNILLMKKKKVITCGVFGHLCLAAKGYDLGAQNKFLEKTVKDYSDVMKDLKKIVLGVRTPMDLAVNINGRRKELVLSEFPSRYEVFDIGSRTILLYKKLIKNSDAVFMKGTAGYCEDAKFCFGTRELLKTIASSKCFSVLSGGHTSTALKKFGISKKKFDYVSLSGGALVWYLVGKKLPGLEVLRK